MARFKIIPRHTSCHIEAESIDQEIIKPRLSSQDSIEVFSESAGELEQAPMSGTASPVFEYNFLKEN
jgi:hypothetical protein